LAIPCKDANHGYVFFNQFSATEALFHQIFTVVKIRGNIETQFAVTLTKFQDQWSGEAWLSFEY